MAGNPAASAIGLSPATHDCMGALKDAPRDQPTAHRTQGIDRLAVYASIGRKVRIAHHDFRDISGARVEARGDSIIVEFNPARLWSDRLTPCPAGALVDVTHDVLERVARRCQEVTPLLAVAPEALHVSRADLVRDFSDVRHASQIVDGLRMVDRSLRYPVATYNNFFVRWEPGSLAIIGRRQRITLYDRHEEDPERLPPGIIRFEVLARWKWLRLAGLTRLSDFTDTRVHQFLSDRWRWACFDFSVVHHDTLLQRVMEQDWRDDEKAMFYWRETKKRSGLAVRMDSRAKARHRHRQAAVGVLGPEAAPASVRLDFETGTEVVV